jgi:hypothetical protein
MSPKHALANLLAQPHVRRDDPSPLAAYAGLWKGAFRPDGDDASLVPFTMRQEGVIAGVHPVLVFPTRALQEVAVRLVEASATAYEAITEPFREPGLDVVVTLRITGTRRHNRIGGRYVLQHEDGSVAREGTFTAARYAPAAQVNYRW